jgi:hypothetical protein
MPSAHALVGSRVAVSKSMATQVSVGAELGTSWPLGECGVWTVFILMVAQGYELTGSHDNEVGHTSVGHNWGAEHMDFMLRTKDTGRVNVERVLARAFVVLGGLFWTLAFFGANTKASYSYFVYTLPEVERAAMYALIPLAITVAVFVLGLFYERVAGLALLVIAGAMLIYGVVGHLGELVLWVTAVSVLVAPSAIAAILYLYAARTQEFQALTPVEAT